MADGWRRLVIGRNPRRTLVRALVVAAAAYVFFGYVLLPARVEGASMSPNYKTGGLTLVNALAYVRSDPQRGDVIAIELAGRSVMLLKRVVGLPGETVSFRHGQVYVEGSPLDEPYVLFEGDWNLPPKRCGEREYYVVGDNRAMRSSAHIHGRVDRSRIVGAPLW